MSCGLFQQLMAKQTTLLNCSGFKELENDHLLIDLCVEYSSLCLNYMAMVFKFLSLWFLCVPNLTPCECTYLLICLVSVFFPLWKIILWILTWLLCLPLFLLPHSVDWLPALACLPANLTWTKLSEETQDHFMLDPASHPTTLLCKYQVCPLVSLPSCKQ